VERTGSSQVGDPHVSDRMWTGTRSSSVVLQSSLIACNRIKSCSEGKFDQKEHDRLRFSSRDDRGRNRDSVNVVLTLLLTASVGCSNKDVCCKVSSRSDLKRRTFRLFKEVVLLVVGTISLKSLKLFKEIVPTTRTTTRTRTQWIAVWGQFLIYHVY